MYTYFSRSPQRKQKLAACEQQERYALARLADNHAGLYEQHGWQLVSLKMYCLTRWTGIHTSVKSILRNWGALCVFKSTLIRDGYGYTAADEDEDSDASLDEDEDEDGDGDADGQAGTQGTLLLAFDNTDTGQPGTVKSK